MNDLVFIVAFLFVSLFVLFQGSLMLVSPEKHARFIDWLSRSDRWSRRNPNWVPGRQLEKRFAGLLLVVVAILMLRLPVSWLLHPRSLTKIGPQSPALAMRGFSWLELIAAAAVSVVGLYLTIRPEAYARWIMRVGAQREYPRDFAQRGASGLRIFGIIIAAVGILLFYFAMRGS